MKPYIDVRSAWPTLFIGMRAFKLDNWHHSITVEEALQVIANWK